jgi:hypothetical protein
MVQAAAASRSSLDQLDEELFAADLKMHEVDKSYGYWYRLMNRHAAKLAHARTPEDYQARQVVFHGTHQQMQAFAQAKAATLNPTFKLYTVHAQAFATAAQKLADDVEATGAPALGSPRDPPLLGAYTNMLAATSSLRIQEENDRLK